MDKLPVKILFVDIDWTIFDHSIEQFDFESLDVLKKAQDKGYIVYISTARPYHSVEQLGLFKHFMPDGIITSNGSAIFYHDEMIYGKEIPSDIVENVCKEAVKHHLNVELTGPKTRYVVSKRLKSVENLYKTFYDVIPEYHKYDGEMVCTMLIIGPSKYDDSIIKYLKPDMFRYRFNELGMDISYSPTEKGNAINIVLKNHNLTAEDALSIGDSNLDVSMFKSTKYSIAVGNAQDVAKENATIIADTIMNHGVGKILMEVLNI